MRSSIFIFIGLITFLSEVSCKKANPTIDIKGIWMDTAYARIMAKNNFPSSSPSEMNELMKTYFFSFNGEDAFYTGMFELNQHFGNYEIKNDSVFIKFNDAFTTAKLKINKQQNQLTGVITDYPNLILKKMED